LASPTCAGIVRWKRLADLNVQRARRDLLQQSLERCCHELLRLASVGGQADPCRDRVHRAEVVERPLCAFRAKTNADFESAELTLGDLPGSRPPTLPTTAVAPSGQWSAKPLPTRLKRRTVEEFATLDALALAAASARGQHRTGARPSRGGDKQLTDSEGD
jgi:hypothetical protein